MAGTDCCIDSLDLNDVEDNNPSFLEKPQDFLFFDYQNEDVQYQSGGKYLFALTCVVGG